VSLTYIHIPLSPVGDIRVIFEIFEFENFKISDLIAINLSTVPPTPALVMWKLL
jgi:hypothetical protein